MQDQQQSGVPLLQGPVQLRFVAGAQITSPTSGRRLGALGLLHSEQLQLAPALMATLGNFASLVAQEVEKGQVGAGVRGRSGTSLLLTRELGCGRAAGACHVRHTLQLQRQAGG